MNTIQPTTYLDAPIESKAPAAKPSAHETPFDKVLADHRASLREAQQQRSESAKARDARHERSEPKRVDRDARDEGAARDARETRENHEPRRANEDRGSDQVDGREAEAHGDGQTAADKQPSGEGGRRGEPSALPSQANAEVPSDDQAALLNATLLQGVPVVEDVAPESSELLLSGEAAEAVMGTDAAAHSEEVSSAAMGVLLQFPVKVPQPGAGAGEAQARGGQSRFAGSGSPDTSAAPNADVQGLRTPGSSLSSDVARLRTDVMATPTAGELGLRSDAREMLDVARVGKLELPAGMREVRPETVTIDPRVVAELRARSAQNQAHGQARAELRSEGRGRESGRVERGQVRFDEGSAPEGDMAAKGTGGASPSGGTTNDAAGVPHHGQGTAEASLLRETLSVRRGQQAIDTEARFLDELNPADPTVRRQNAAVAAVNQMTLRRGAEVEVDLPELGKIHIDAKMRGGEVDVRVIAHQIATQQILHNAGQDMQDSLRNAHVPLGEMLIGGDEEGRGHSSESGTPNADAHAEEAARAAEIATSPQAYRPGSKRVRIVL